MKEEIAARLRSEMVAWARENFKKPANMRRPVSVPGMIEAILKERGCDTVKETADMIMRSFQDEKARRRKLKLPTMTEDESIEFLSEEIVIFFHGVFEERNL